MKLVEALQLLKKAPADATLLPVFLVCGCTPSHLQTFLAAHLQARRPQRRVRVETGLFGDCLGSLDRLARADAEAAAVVLEWPDFDPRLGLRHLGGWRSADLPDILQTVQDRTAQYQEALARAARGVPVALCLPTLPVPPVACKPGFQADAFDLELRACLTAFASWAARQDGIKVVHPQRLDQVSPPADRRDVQAEIVFGFPYRLAHADTVAESLARLLLPDTPKKGIITDLDDTLWAGLLGEVGPGGVSWDLDHQSQLHGLYQQLLRSLAEAGVLVAVASKNDPARVEEAFRREDLLLTRRHVYPVEAHWGPKSQSVGRILRAWNVAADSVIFVDDSPLEIAEVQAAHPGVEGVLFPKGDYAAAYALLEWLRDGFGKDRVAAEDAIRLDSLRRQAALPHDGPPANGVALDHFLQQARAELTLSDDKSYDARAFELLNKTNQFNLNGRRFTEGAWRQRLADPEAFVWVVEYADKFGPLGKIAVLSGRRDGDGLCVDTWVMSCRAFARRIEHRCLEQLYQRFGVDVIAFDMQPTPKNGPLQEFFAHFLGRPPVTGFRLALADFAPQCPRLFHQLTEPVHG